MSDHKELCANLYANPEAYCREAADLIEAQAAENAELSDQLINLREQGKRNSAIVDRLIAEKAEQAAKGLAKVLR